MDNSLVWGKEFIRRFMANQVTFLPDFNWFVIKVSLKEFEIVVFLDFSWNLETLHLVKKTLAIVLVNLVQLLDMLTGHCVLSIWL